MWKSLNRASQFFDEPNEYRILRLVRDSSTISRTEIARLCQISKPTVSEIVNRFLEGGFLEIVGEAASSERGGRKRELLRFNAEAGYVVGVDIRRTDAIIAITDLNAKILTNDTVSYAVKTPAADVLDLISQSIKDLSHSSPEYLNRCVGIGIGLPGLIDHVQGVVKLADTLRGWEGINLRSYFHRKFAVPVYVDNDVKARTLAEFLFGAGRNTWEQVFLWIGAGIGVGIIIDGKLHRGITESAGEVGYNELRFGSAGKEFFPILYSNQRDYGEILSNAVICERYRVKAKVRKEVTLEEILERADAGEKLASQLLEEVALLTGIVCINLINTLNPELLVLGGRLTENGSTLLDRVQKKVSEDLLSIPAEAVHIVTSQLQAEGVILGAVGLVLYDLFKPAPRQARSQRTYAA